ncbi:MAG: 50S ribosomal protein L21 [Candidatus Cardinium sp.]|nr:50S ribosomal protein L21 [Candidatus Cardinium sp.]
MYAIIEVGGKQFKASENQQLYIPKLADEVGTSCTLGKVLLLDDAQGNVRMGNPIVEGVTVQAKVLGHDRGDKIIVFKKKRRKGYKVKRGHRQDYTKIIIESILK